MRKGVANGYPLVWDALKRRLWAFFFLCLLAFASSEYLFVARRGVPESLIFDFLAASVVIFSVGMSIVFRPFLCVQPNGLFPCVCAYWGSRRDCLQVEKSAC
jgi:hypothetical protein